MIGKRANLKTELTRKQNPENFSENELFFLPLSYLRVHVRKVRFLENLGSLFSSYIRFALLTTNSSVYFLFELCFKEVL